MPAPTRNPISEHKGCSIVETIGSLRDQWCLYAIQTARPEYQPQTPGTPFFIGVCRLRDLFMIPDALRNTLVRTLKQDDQIQIQLMATCATSSELYQMQADYVKRFRPIANTKGFSMTANRTSITCIQGPLEGHTFRTQLDAAMATGLAQGTISNHLNGVKGYETIAGMKFTRGLGDAID